MTAVADAIEEDRKNRNHAALAALWASGHVLTDEDHEAIATLPLVNIRRPDEEELANRIAAKRHYMELRARGVPKAEAIAEIAERFNLTLNLAARIAGGNCPEVQAAIFADVP